jgi:regulator of sigma E protease
MASEEEEALAALEGGAAHTPVPADRLFESKPVWKRFIVLGAGVTMNVLFAWVVYSGLALTLGRTITLETRVGAVDSTLVPDGGKALLAIVPGDRIVSINGESIASWNDVMDQLQNAAGDSLAIAMASGHVARLSIPADAVGERMKAAAALQPWRPAVVGSLEAGGAAEKAGLLAGDSVVEINGAPVESWTDLSRIVTALPRTALPVAFIRDGQRREIELVTDSAIVADSGKATRVVGRLGVYTAPLASRHEPVGPAGAVGEGASQTWATVIQIGRSVRGMLTGQVAGRELGGPILIGQLAGRSAKLGAATFLAFMALISVNLAVLNLLPIPLLDGGQLVFLLAEGVLRRPLPLKLREVLSMMGLVILVLLMVFVFWNDIRRLIVGA